MTTPRIEIDLTTIRRNTRFVVDRLRPRGIGVTAVTKAVCGHPAIARAMLAGGAAGLCDSRVGNIRRLRAAGLTGPISLIRSPSPSQVDLVVRYCDVSYNTDADVIAALARAAQRAGRIHRVVLMVEMGDMRDGILPADLERIASRVVAMPGVALVGVAANFACLRGIAPTANDMATLSVLAADIAARCGVVLGVVSGGNSANLGWALGSGPVGRINDLRIGEAILLGVDPITGAKIAGLSTDAFTLVAEVIEAGTKPQPAPARPGSSMQIPWQIVPMASPPVRFIVALGRQDTDISGLTPQDDQICLGATSDHLVMLTTAGRPPVGSEVRLRMNYNALVRAMGAADVAKTIVDPSMASGTSPHRGPHLDLVPS
ncbi:alanine racemase [Jannaschia donghaensis]|uniref:Alanine racemase n=1 Tax=Jannaschia donghaensis TaxID=420998 RepID=A0A0M6YDY5_9RHOB|nr:alanine racemase [Jannaschia donghaensis]CTQ48538.1 alanine racemase [Jannaschia donghaensis]